MNDVEIFCALAYLFCMWRAGTWISRWLNEKGML